jgi:CheY-like chemotaxis protein
MLVHGTKNPALSFPDLNMPLMNCEQFLNEIIQIDKLKIIPAVILSTNSDSTITDKTLRLGASEFVTKPD